MKGRANSCSSALPLRNQSDPQGTSDRIHGVNKYIKFHKELIKIAMIFFAEIPKSFREKGKRLEGNELLRDEYLQFGSMRGPD